MVVAGVAVVGVVVGVVGEGEAVSSADPQAATPPRAASAAISATVTLARRTGGWVGENTTLPTYPTGQPPNPRPAWPAPPAPPRLCPPHLPLVSFASSSRWTVPPEL